MRLIAVKEIPDISRKGSGRNDIYSIIEEFIKSKNDKAEVIISGGEYITVDVAYRSVFTCVSRYGLDKQVRVMKRGSHIYLAKIY